MTTTLQVCPVPTFRQVVIPQCPVREFGLSQQLLFMQLLQQLRASQIHNVCLDLVSELENERKGRHQPRNVRRVLEIQCLHRIHLQIKLRNIQERRKEREDRLQKLEEKNLLDLEEAEERITNFLDHLKKSDIDITKSDSMPVLNWAAAFGSPFFVSKLVANGADVHSRDKWQNTPLSLAASKGQSEVVKLLIELGSDVKARDEKGLTPLHDAAISGCVETTTALLENGDGIEIDVKSNDGYTPLFVAANHGHLPVVELLLKHGADINARNNKGNNALMTAVDIGYVDIVCWLMQNVEKIDMNPNEANDTPLNVAVRNGNLAIIKCLLENGFPVSEIEDVPSLLMEAVGTGNVEIVNLLVKFGAKVNHEDEQGITPLLRAAQKNNFKIVQILVQHGADLSAVDQDGRTAEAIARYRNYQKIEKFLKNARKTGSREVD